MTVNKYEYIVFSLSKKIKSTGLMIKLNNFGEYGWCVVGMNKHHIVLQKGEYNDD